LLFFFVSFIFFVILQQSKEYTDERLKKINEILLGIKLIKLNAWEKVYKEKINECRRKELKYLDLDSLFWTLMSEYL
jgi:hypothetical protein